MTIENNPYVGPRSFETGEKLYGRDREIRSLMALLIAERIVLLHSPSGAGKTSLLKAGLLPRLREENFNVMPVVRVNIEPPRDLSGVNRYVLSTMSSLEDKYPPEQRLPLATLAGMSLDEYLTQRVTEPDTLLVIDQFEEILTTASTDRDGKLEFFNQIGAALRNKSRWALFSMREDYLGMLAPYVRPIPNRLVTRMRLDLLATEAAIQAVQMPAEAAGVHFAETAAQQLVDDLRRIQVQLPDGNVEMQLGQYVEPVQLQVVCFRLWETLKPEDKNINEEDLDKVGNVNDSLADYYTQSIVKTAKDSEVPERSIREWFERELITPDKLRGQVRMGVDQSKGLPNKAVRLLVDTHLIRAEQRAGQTWLELSHDRMVEPVRSSNKNWFQANLSLFQRQAELWEEKGHSENLLLRGTDLAQAEEEVKSLTLTDDEKEYLKACRSLKRRNDREKILRRGIFYGFIVAIAMFFVAVYFSIQASASNENSMRAAATAEAASTEALAQKAIAETARVQALDQQATAEAASIEAYAQKALADSARLRALEQQATAEAASAQAEIEKAKAVEQEVIAKEQREEAQKQKLEAQANSVVAQSLLQQIRLKDDLSNLLAAAAFRLSDFTRTRTQMLATVYSRGRMPQAQSANGGMVVGLGFSADGNKLAASYFQGCQKGNFTMCDTGVVRLWTIRRDNRPGSNQPISVSQDGASIDPPGFLDTSALSANGKLLATASCIPAPQNSKTCLRESFQLWDLETRQPAGSEMVFNSGPVSADKDVRLLFSPDGKTLVAALNINTINNTSSATKNTLIFWNAETYAQEQVLTLQNDLAALTFSPDGATLALANGSKITLMDAVSRETRDLADAGAGKKIHSLAYSPDGKMLAVGTENGLIRLLDPQTGQADPQVLVNNSRILELAFSHDGKVLASGSQDAGLVLWDVPGRQRLINPTIYKHNENPDVFPIYGLVFSPDGKQLASYSDEIILWDMDPESWANKSCQIAGRNFTQAEWQQFFPGEEYRVICEQFPAGR